MEKRIPPNTPSGTRSVCIGRWTWKAAETTTSSMIVGTKNGHETWRADTAVPVAPGRFRASLR